VVSEFGGELVPEGDRQIKTSIITGQRGSLLTRREIEQLGIISEHFSPSCIRPTSYDLRLGDQYMLPGQDHGATRTLIGNSKLIIPKFSSAIVSTHEILKMPPNVAAKFNLKIKFALRGLFVQMGLQVEPNYYGRLFALLQNISDQTVELSPKADDGRIFAIEFIYTTMPIPIVDSGFMGKKYTRMADFIVNNLISGTINNITTELDGRIDKIEHLQGRSSVDLDGVKLRIDEIFSHVKESTDRLFSWRITLLGAVLFAVLAIIVSVVAPVVGRAVFDEPSSRLAELREEVHDLNERIDKLADAQLDARTPHKSGTPVLSKDVMPGRTMQQAAGRDAAISGGQE
jgi:deoxycytidine triphosphate deaminase